MSVSEEDKCIEGRNKKLSIIRQCELLQLPHSSYYRPRSSLTEGPGNLELMRLIDEKFLRHPLGKQYFSFPTLDPRWSIEDGLF
jgi:putative transposase